LRAGNTEMTKNSLRVGVIESLAELTRRSVEGIVGSDELVKDLGIDSLMIANLLTTIEDHLGTFLPNGCEGSLVTVRTVDDLVDRLSEAFMIETGARRKKPRT
jgi:acyl carrier protein